MGLKVHAHEALAEKKPKITQPGHQQVLSCKATCKASSQQQPLRSVPIYSSRASRTHREICTNLQLACACQSHVHIAGQHPVDL